MSDWVEEIGLDAEYRDAFMPDALNDEIAKVLGDGGILARNVPGYEIREEQIRLSRRVLQAMRAEQHLIAEAPTGVGKSIAYLVPAVLLAKQKARTVVLTANIALQEQIIKKDLPSLLRSMGMDVKFALLKGMNNFVCKDKVDTRQADIETDVEFRKIVLWAQSSKTGDVSELPFQPSRPAMAATTTSFEECKGNECRFKRECFAMKHKADAVDADIVVSNYHMLFASMKSNGAALGDPDFIVCDEAHEMPDIARDFFGTTVSLTTFQRLMGSLDVGKPQVKDLGKLRSKIMAEAGLVFDGIKRFGTGPYYKNRIVQPNIVRTNGLVRAVFEMTNAMSDRLNAIADKSKPTEAETDETTWIRKWISAAKDRIDFLNMLLSNPDGDYAVCIEDDRKNGSARLVAKKIVVSDIIGQRLFGKVEGLLLKSVIAMSATMRTGGTFSFIRNEMGVSKDTAEIVVGTPFDYKKQSILVLQRNMPEPSSPDFPPAVARVLQQVIDIFDGRTLGLFTSYRVLNEVVNLLDMNGRKLLVQGDQPRSELARIFREDVRSVLLGTDSFWTGLDVPGEALSAVVIDKLPFPNMNDPVMDAIKARDQRSFFTQFVPRAVMQFRQGFGRLIRSSTDRGAVIVCDSRLVTKPYGRVFLADLPSMYRTTDVGDAERFFRASPPMGGTDGSDGGW